MLVSDYTLFSNSITRKINKNLYSSCEKKREINAYLGKKEDVLMSYSLLVTIVVCVMLYLQAFVKDFLAVRMCCAFNRKEVISIN